MEERYRKIKKKHEKKYENNRKEWRIKNQSKNYINKTKIKTSNNKKHQAITRRLTTSLTT